MHVSQRAELSRDLNAAILALQCKPSTSCIANIIKCVVRSVCCATSDISCVPRDL
jgi:hypothetical protein